jgi:hypothetical protein
MYEMYPEAWTMSEAQRLPETVEPRRRARKEHCVVPPVLRVDQTVSTVRRPEVFLVGFSRLPDPDSGL